MRRKARKFDPSLEYYVIVGCGFSAITNHAILQKQRASGRLGTLPVLHIGGADPWREYFSMAMGQWPPLMSLPGFGSNPSALGRRDHLRSDEFADVTDQEWNRLLAAHPVYHIDAKVIRIQPPGTGTNAYRIVLDDQASTLVYAAMIDICGGPGPAVGLPSSSYLDSTLETEFQSGTSTFHFWPRVLSGERFLSGTQVQRTTAGSLCVVGGGPTAAWCVEHAQANGDSVVWVSREPLQAAFVASRRNDGLLQGPVTRKLDKGIYVIDSPMLPASPGTTFGEGVGVSDLNTTYGGQVSLNILPLAGTTPQFTDQSGAIAPISSLDVDQVVIAFGQETEFNQSGSWAYKLQRIIHKTGTSNNHLIPGRENRFVGLQSADQRVRILGAAALSHPDLKPEWRPTGTASNLFFRSLPEQARVHVGIAVAALTIAEANGTWTAGGNDNLNTAGLKDIEYRLSALPGFAEAARTWLEMRAARIPPFDQMELASFFGWMTNY